MIDGRVRTREALAQLLPAAFTAIPFAIADRFEAELDGYTEIIVGPGGRPAGFMTHGDGPQFTERVRTALQMLGLPSAALLRHEAMARHFDHIKGFAKFEWQVSGDGELDPLAAIYFRRRPPIEEVLDRFDEWGVAVAGRERIAKLAATLEKDTIHFVSAAFRPGHPVHHKVYFSQWVTPDTRGAVASRIARVFELYGFGGGTVSAWREPHDRAVATGDRTVFVSMSCSEDGVSPSFKIDYPDLLPADVAAWLPADRRPEVALEVGRTMAMAGSKQLTFLGVRFAGDRPAPSLKYYADVPGSR